MQDSPQDDPTRQNPQAPGTPPSGTDKAPDAPPSEWTTAGQTPAAGEIPPASAPPPASEAPTSVAPQAEAPTGEEPPAPVAVAASEQPGGNGGGGGGARVALIVALLAAVGAGAFYGGRMTADLEGAERRGFARGQEAAEVNLRPGSPRYNRIFAAGRAAGLKEGRQAPRAGGAENGREVQLFEGEESGPLSGDEAAIEAGARAALGNFEDWETGSFYLVKIESGEQSIPFTIVGRRKVDQGQRFALCAKEPTNACYESAPATGGSSARDDQ